MKNLFIIIASLLVISCSKSEYGWKWGKKYERTGQSAKGEWIKLKEPDQIIVFDGSTESTYTFTISNGSCATLPSNLQFCYYDGTFTTNTLQTYK